MKQELSSPAVLAQYSSKWETLVSADASSWGLGGALMQRRSDWEFRPVVYISKGLTPNGTQYTQIEEEAVAVTWVCERQSTYLLGLDFTVHTVHKSLISLLGFCPLDDLTSHILRFRTVTVRKKSAKFTLTTTWNNYTQQKQNWNIWKTCRMVTVRWWLVHRKAVPELLIPYWPHRADIHMADGILLKGEWILVPAPMCREMLDKIHHGHQGMTKCRQSTTLHMVARIIQTSGSWWKGVTYAANSLCTGQSHYSQHL